mmetsp:Transcript_2209/g.5163  ORF Transcript_2209/g.5163 Transcript_2209/m.5163 type:complete len:216 (+) Transcript_2209:80-727(+)
MVEGLGRIRPDEPALTANAHRRPQRVQGDIADGLHGADHETDAADEKDRAHRKLRQGRDPSRRATVPLYPAVLPEQSPVAHSRVDLRDHRRGQGSGEVQKSVHARHERGQEECEDEGWDGEPEVAPDVLGGPRVTEARGPGLLAEAHQGHRVEHVRHEVAGELEDIEGRVQVATRCPGRHSPGDSDDLSHAVAPPLHNGEADDERDSHIQNAAEH